MRRTQHPSYDILARDASPESNLRKCHTNPKEGTVYISHHQQDQSNEHQGKTLSLKETEEILVNVAHDAGLVITELTGTI